MTGAVHRIRAGVVMRQSLRLGRIAGIPVGVHWSVLVIVGLLAQGLGAGLLPAAAPGAARWSYWVVAGATALLFGLSLLAHELAHALVALHHGVRVERVTLWLLGGLAELDGEPPTPRADLQIALAGPATSLLAGVGGLGTAAALTAVSAGPKVVVAALLWLGVMNLLLAVFNLLPAAPLDGGRILRAALWSRWHDWTRAAVAAARAGQALGGGLLTVAALELLVTGSLDGLWLALVGWFVVSAATTELRSARYAGRLGTLPVRAAMDPHPAVCRSTQSVAEFVTTAAARLRQRWFPVVDEVGHPVGWVTLTNLSRVPATRRPTTTVGAVMVASRACVPADRPLAAVGPAIATSGPLPVVDNGVLVGVLGPAEVARALDLADLGLLDPGAGIDPPRGPAHR